MNKFKDWIKGIIILAYILLIGDMIINSNRYNFNEEWLFIANIVLLCIGFYYFVNQNNKEK